MNGNTWVNPHYRTNRTGPNRRGRAGKKSSSQNSRKYSSATRGKSASSSGKRPAQQASSSAHPSWGTAQDSLLDQLATFAQQVDLPKVRHTLKEMNAVMEQMNGIFQKLPRFQSPEVPYGTRSQQTQQQYSRHQPYQRPHPFHPVYPESQHAYHRYFHPQQPFPGPYRRGHM